MLQRRSFLGLLATLPWLMQAAKAVESRLQPVLSAWQNADGSYAAGAVGHSANAQTLPGRAHAVIARPGSDQEAIVVARRPGEYLARINWQTNQILQLAELSEDWRLMGHAVYGADGFLYASEIATETGEGWVSVRDPNTLQVIRRFATGGIGPHELLFLHNGDLAVANGGILTLPETGRLKRNLDSMQPSLVMLDSAQGQIKSRHELPDTFLSIRHLAQAPDGTLALALQSERGPDQPILAFYRNGALHYAATPAEGWATLKGYAASVSVCQDVFAITCPKGHRVVLWRSDGQYLESLVMPSPSGITSGAAEFWVSNEQGEIRQLALTDRNWGHIEHFPVRWDNHLTLQTAS